MTNNNSEVEKNEVIKMGKMPENNTSEGNTKSANINCKVTPEQKERLKAEMQFGGFKSLSNYIMFKLFNDAPAITLPEGHKIFLKLSECADLLNALSVGDTHNIDTLFESFRKIEESITQIFDYMDVIKDNVIDGKDGE